MSTLNPHAAPFVPQRMPTAVEEKSLFMTFSHGSPLNQQEISDYFNRYNIIFETYMILLRLI